MANFSKKSLKDWNKLAQKELDINDSSTNLNWTSQEGIEVKSLYTEEDLNGLEHLDTMPGFAPFVRGPKATMYFGRPWSIRQYAGFSTAQTQHH